MKEFVTDEEAQSAIDYLAESAKDYAFWKARMKYLELHRKSVRAAEYLAAKGNTIQENNSIAENSPEYRDALNEYKEAVYEYEMLNAYRNAAEARIEAWRTISASNRRGNI